MPFHLHRCRLLWSFLAACTPLTVDAAESAWEQYRQGEFDAAIKTFRESQARAATPKARLKALYGEAHVWNYRSSGRDLVAARRLYEKLRDDAPEGHQLVAWGEFEAAQAAHVYQPADQRDTPADVERYLQVYQQYPATDAGEEAWINAMTLKVAGLKPEIDPAIAEIRAFLASHPSTPWRSQCHTLLASLYQRKGEPRRQIDELILSAQTLTSAKNAPAPDYSGLYYQIATIAEFQLGDFSMAREYCELFLKEYARDNRTFTIRQALERMARLEREIQAGRVVPPTSDLK